MYRTLKLVFGVAIFSLAVMASAEERRSSVRVARLRSEYDVTNDPVERLILASNLARAGDYSHWSFVQTEAEKAIRHDERRRWWKIPFGSIRRQSNRQRHYDLLPTGTERVAYSEKIVVAPSEPEHALDVWRVMALASGAPLEDKPLLLRGLRSPRVLIAGNAALGLARLNDVEAADAIRRAGEGVPHAQRLLFVQALVYLHDDYAMRLAKSLAREKPELVTVFEELAVDQHYDPFWSAEED